MIEFLKRLLCRHPSLWLLVIQMDDGRILPTFANRLYRCPDCGKEEWRNEFAGEPPVAANVELDWRTRTWRIVETS